MKIFEFKGFIITKDRSFFILICNNNFFKILLAKYPYGVYNPIYLIENKIYRRENAMGECCKNKEDISLSCHCGANDSFKSSSSQPKCQNCSVKKKVRSEKEFKALLNRLSRIEGQVRGVRSMLENDAYCIDILTQVSAINAALNSFNKVLISNHIRTCVKENIQAGNDEVIDELVVTLQKLMK